MRARVSMHFVSAMAADSHNGVGWLTIEGATAEMSTAGGDARIRHLGEYRASVFIPEARAAELAAVWNRPGVLSLYELLLREVDPRLLTAEPSPMGGLLYRRCHVSRLPLGSPIDGWQWQHEDAEPGDHRHGVCGTVAGCLDEIDVLLAEHMEAAA